MASDNTRLAVGYATSFATFRSLGEMKKKPVRWLIAVRVLITGEENVKDKSGQTSRISS